MTLTFLDFFSGVGGFRLGMEQAKHRCIGYVEWDKFARASYEAIHNTEGEWTNHDINNIKSGTIPKADVWCFGFPCTDISIASGRATGLKGARSGLFYKTIELLKGVPPAFRKKTTLRKSELKNQKIYHYSKTHTVSFFIQKIIQHNINCVVLGVIININLGV